jgi:hypothetical protein
MNSFCSHPTCRQLGQSIRNLFGIIILGKLNADFPSSQARNSGLTLEAFSAMSDTLTIL